MNTNPNAIRILCFGDSNTWGQKPDKSGRYSANIRWTGQLQDLLGSKFSIIEEGMGGRTTDINPPGRNDRSGLQYLLQAAKSHSPLDMFILMLGTNDCKTVFNRSAKEIAEGVERCVTTLLDRTDRASGRAVQVVVVTPAAINASKPLYSQMYTDTYDESAPRKSKELNGHLKDLCSRHKWVHVDANDHTEVGDDGIHLRKRSHENLAKALANTIML